MKKTAVLFYQLQRIKKLSLKDNVAYKGLALVSQV
jgi:hypothetical protein